MEVFSPQPSQTLLHGGKGPFLTDEFHILFKLPPLLTWAAANIPAGLRGDRNIPLPLSQPLHDLRLFIPPSGLKGKGNSSQGSCCWNEPCSLWG